MDYLECAESFEEILQLSYFVRQLKIIISIYQKLESEIHVNQF